MDFVYTSLEKHLEELRDEYAGAVDSIIRVATEAAENGAYTINFENIPGEFDMLADRYLFSEMLLERDEIIGAEVHGSGIALRLDPQYCKQMIVDPDTIPDDHLQSQYAIDLIAGYENLLPVKAIDRVTHYWGDYGGYVKVHGVTDEQFRSIYAEALQAVNMSSEAYHDRRFIYRGEVETYMRSCMLAKILESEDKIVFIPPAPTGVDGQWQYEAGTVTEVDAASKNCVVTFEDGEATIPFRYVLARFRDQEYDGNAFGFEHAEAIFGLHESWDEHFLWEAQREYEQRHTDENEMPDEDESTSMVMT